GGLPRGERRVGAPGGMADEEVAPVVRRGPGGPDGGRGPPLEDQRRAEVERRRVPAEALRDGGVARGGGPARRAAPAPDGEGARAGLDTLPPPPTGRVAVARLQDGHGEAEGLLEDRPVHGVGRRRRRAELL